MDGQRGSQVKMKSERRLITFRENLLVLCCTASFPFPSSLGISSQLCATCQQRKFPGRCCSMSTPRPCWWTSCLRAGLSSGEKPVSHPQGIPAWRQPALLCSTSLLQSQRESGSWFIIIIINVTSKPSVSECLPNVYEQYLSHNLCLKMQTCKLIVF